MDDVPIYGQDQQKLSLQELCLIMTNLSSLEISQATCTIDKNSVRADHAKILACYFGSPTSIHCITDALNYWNDQPASWLYS